MMSPASSAPAVSVIIPSFESHATARATLESLRQQTFRDFEIILIDSSESDAIADIARDFPEVHFHHAEQRLLPHEARNVGVKLARYDLLLFTDPDIVAKPDWIERMLAAHGATNGAIAGAVTSLQKTWLCLGVHLAKFDLWLPGGPSRTVPVAASVNFLCSRALLAEAGGFNGREMIGDTLLSWELVRRGNALHFAPDAVVDHDHRSTFAQLLRERFARGADFARLRTESENWDTARTCAMFFATIFPLRLVKLVGRTFAACVRSRCLLDFFGTWPVVAAGHGAWLAGEATQYWRRLLFWRTSREAGRRAHRNAGA
jgi:glycosyltransferase involved in cell wall biosynthesis